MAGGLQDVELRPGVNSQVTLAENQAGVSVSQLIRYKEGRVQKLGGWAPYYALPLSADPIRAIWPSCIARMRGLGTSASIDGPFARSRA